jgi:fructose-bisphosphate aldolase class I
MAARCSTRRKVALAGKTDNVSAAQAAFSHRAEMNGLATLGQWTPEIEKRAA